MLFRMLRTLFLLLAVCSLFGQDSNYRPDREQIPGPPSPGDFANWLADIKNGRIEKWIRGRLSPLHRPTRHYATLHSAKPALALFFNSPFDTSRRSSRRLHHAFVLPIWSAPSPVHVGFSHPWPSAI